MNKKNLALIIGGARGNWTYDIVGTPEKDYELLIFDKSELNIKRKEFIGDDGSTHYFFVSIY